MQPDDRPRAPRSRHRFLRAGASAALALVAYAVAGLVQSGVSGDAGPTLAADAQTRPKLRLGAPAPDITFETTDGEERRLSDFRGKPVMLWFIATWCPTCFAATTALAERFDELKRSELQIVQLKLYENLGFPGPSIVEFARKYAGDAYPAPEWLWGDASLDASMTYDPMGFPDIYFLIDRNGILRDADTAPNATMDKIRDFVRRQAS